MPWVALTRRLEDDGAGLAIVADQAIEYGGIERALEAVLRRFPEADLVAPGFRPTPGSQGHFERRLERMRRATNGDGPAWRGELRLAGAGGPRRHFLGPVYARRIARHPLDDAAVVLSVGGAAWSLAAATPPGARHLAWIGGPPRALYSHTRAYLSEYPTALRPVLRASIPALRAHHRHLLRRPRRIFSNSRYSADRLEELAQRDVRVLYPPVRTDYFTPAERPRQRFAAVARLRFSKRVNLLIDAFRGLDHELVVAGDGPLLESLRAQAPPNVELVGHLGDEELRELYRSSAGMLSASVEEFGICLVEALAAGTPVLAPREGGASEIVEHRRNGLLLDTVTPEAIAAGVRELAGMEVDRAACRASAERFSEERFVAEIEGVLGSVA
ncbi:MAG TPA: glycosyltransferase [Thermoleophilaceae bacterium]